MCVGTVGLVGVCSDVWRPPMIASSYQPAPKHVVQVKITGMLCVADSPVWTGKAGRRAGRWLVLSLLP